MSKTTAKIQRIQPASSNPDYVCAFTASFRDTEGVIHPGKCVPFHKDEVEALDIKVDDYINVDD